ncbi:hypothetical protein C8N47_1038 [Mangrovibacterium marinum]|uniref:Uncharacterized protein n=1 Tax=Mangrovibacterium marinum TaxID=1639118 RepID=A0A2T5C4D9_9BACT|nr:hypothetical protein C8N47_1038 [Mangrovibacterium marinum]
MPENTNFRHFFLKGSFVLPDGFSFFSNGFSHYIPISFKSVASYHFVPMLLFQSIGIILSYFSA